MARSFFAGIFVSSLFACSSEPATAPPPEVASAPAPAPARDPQVPEEAASSLQAIAAKARAAYQKNGKLCGTSTNTVPVFVMKVNGTAYQSQAEEWTSGDDTRGFRCLQFSISTPQRFMYSYVSSDPKTFEAIASWTPNGDGKLIAYAITGSVAADGSLTIGPITEKH